MFTEGIVGKWYRSKDKKIEGVSNVENYKNFLSCCKDFEGGSVLCMFWNSRGRRCLSRVSIVCEVRLER